MREGWAERNIKKMVDNWSSFFWDAFNALAFNGITGDYAEFGSHCGTTLWLAYQEMVDAQTPRHLWAFDSFQGLPRSSLPLDDHPAWPRSRMSTTVADFDAVCEARGIPSDAYTTVVGFYADTLAALGADGAPGDIALAYVDCDMYSSTVSVLEFLRPRLKHGMIIAFDDYYCWTEANVSGERAAFAEFSAANPSWNFHRYREIGWAGTSFVVESAPAPPGVATEARR